MNAKKAKLLEMEAGMVLPSTGDWVVGGGGEKGGYWSRVQIRWVSSGDLT